MRVLAPVACAVVALLAGPGAGAARAATCNYTGPSGGSWATPGNWDCAHEPTSADTAVLAGGDSVLVTSADATAGAVSADSGATLAFANNRKLTVVGASTLGSATVTGTGTFAPAGFTKTGTGQLMLGSGVIVNPSADSSFAAGVICVQDGATLQVSIALAVAAAADGFNCSGSTNLIRITATGSITATGGTHTWFTLMDVDGLLRVQAGALTLAGAGANTDAGAVTVDAGAALTLSAPRSFAASAAVGGAGSLVVGSAVTVPDGATLNPASLTASGGTLTVNGSTPATTLASVTLNGGTLAGTRNLSVGTLTAQNGALSGAHTITVTGGLTKTTSGQLALNGGVTLNSTVDWTWSAGDICLTGGATLPVATLLTVQSTAGAFNCSDSSSFVAIKPTGQITVTGGTRTWFSILDIDGFLDLQGGALTLAAAGANTDVGATSIVSGASLAISAAHTYGGSASLGGAGSLIIGSAVTIPDGATLNPASLTASGGTLTVNGSGPATTLPSVILNGGTVSGTRNLSVGTLTAQNGALSGAHTITVTGGLTKTTSGQLALNGGVTLSSTVDWTWSGGDICLQSGATLPVATALTVQATAGAFNCSDATAFVAIKPTGQITVTGGTRSWSSITDIDGLLTLQGGALTLNGPSANADAGTTSIAAGASLAISAARTFAGSSSLSGAGSLIIGSAVTIPDGATLNPASLTASGGTLTVNGSGPATTLPSVSLNGGTVSGTRNLSVGTLAAQNGALSGAHTITVTGTLTKTTSGQLVLNGGVTLNSTVDWTWSGGDICLQSGATLPVATALTVQATAGAFNCSDATAFVAIKPTGQITVAGGTRSWSSITDIDGLLTLQGGALTLDGPSANADAGTTSIAAGTSLAISGARTLGTSATLGGAGSLVIGSTVTVPAGATLNPASLTASGGTLTVNGASPATTLPTVVLAGGTLTGTRNLAVGTLAAENGTLSGAHDVTATTFTKTTPGQLTLDQGVTLAPQQDASSGPGPICILNGARLLLAHAFTLEPSSSGFNCTSGSPLVEIAAGGSLLRSGAGATTLFTPVRNSGLVSIGGDQTLSFVGGLTNTTGTLAGTGTAGGAIANPGGVVSPGSGSTPGRLTLSGSYTQGAGGTLRVDAAGGSTDQLAVSGAAALDGTLAIVRDSAFNPSPESAFTVLTSGSRSGTFGTLTGAAITATKAFTVDYPANAPFGARLVVKGTDPPPAENPPPPPPTETTPTTPSSPPVTTTPPTTSPPPLTGATKDKVAGAFGLPPSRRCVKRSTLSLRLRPPAGVAVETVSLKIAGRTVRLRKSGSSYVAVLRRRTLPRKSIPVTFRATTKDGRTLRGARTYAVCR